MGENGYNFGVRRGLGGRKSTKHLTVARVGVIEALARLPGIIKVKSTTKSARCSCVDQRACGQPSHQQHNEKHDAFLPSDKFN